MNIYRMVYVLTLPRSYTPPFSLSTVQCGKKLQAKKADKKDDLCDSMFPHLNDAFSAVLSPLGR
jgi:hypothetical protein